MSLTLASHVDRKKKAHREYWIDTLRLFNNSRVVAENRVANTILPSGINQLEKGQLSRKPIHEWRLAFLNEKNIGKDKRVIIC